MQALFLIYILGFVGVTDTKVKKNISDFTSL